ncbi:hypothetical protein O181_015760 [Austropuccinia psidii MF-1]|uniref:Uncharacterized protein n=1 Tax=Austropuccinia psidii MF-1 TaxID=1389203 RepID=A0A9Q3C3J7_9BASI|nr:hypothetical protein [Austropuccinia psidii MF-1]
MEPQKAVQLREISRTTLRAAGKDDAEEEESSRGTKASPAPVGASRVTGGKTIAQSNKPFSQHPEPFVLAVMQKMNQIKASFNLLHIQKYQDHPLPGSPLRRHQPSLWDLALYI